MQTKARQRSWFFNWLPWMLLVTILGLLSLRQQIASWSVWNIYLQSFTMLFISMLLGALPFVLLGCLISSAIHFYLSDEMLARMLRKNYYLGLLTASLLGIVFPVGGYAVVPFAQGLLKKGVSVSAATTFLLAAPVVNPIVMTATYRAFGGSIGAVLLRTICGWLLALFMGDLVGRLYQKQQPFRQPGFYEQREERPSTYQSSRFDRSNTHQSLLDVLQHPSDQLFLIGRWLILGTLLVAAVRTFVPVALQSGAGRLTFLTIPLFMTLAYLLSTCAEADAFLARGFAGMFAGSSLLAFMLLGPVLNLRNTTALLGKFERPFVRHLFTIGTACVLVMAVVANLFNL